MQNNNVLQEINELRKKRRAIILAHNYQPGPIQDLADLTGDSLELSRKAKDTDADVIVFCGVRFMAETAAILNPQKIVLLPDLEAGCPMADMITAGDVKRIKEQFPGIPIITYVNSNADVKAESTICCTSANSINVVNSFEEASEVYMAPDQNLAKYTAKHTEKKVHHWNGFCPIHHNLKVEYVHEARKKYPDAVFIAHPECKPEVLDLADGVFSTSGMINYVSESEETFFIIGTEMGLIHTLKKNNPHKTFVPLHESLVCKDMKKITLEKILYSLKNLTPRITVPEPIRQKAQQALDRMLTIKVASGDYRSFSSKLWS